MRDTNELKKAIKTAEEAVEDMHDPILKTAAFQTILKELLPKQKEETNQSEQKFSSFSQGNVNVNQTMPLEVFQTTSDGFKIIANFGLQYTNFYPYIMVLIPLLILIPVIILELGVAVIQAYVFTMLTASYIKDAELLH